MMPPRSTNSPSPLSSPAEELRALLLRMAELLSALDGDPRATRELLHLGLVALPRNALYQECGQFIGPLLRSWLSLALQAGSVPKDPTSGLNTVLEQIARFDSLS